MLHLRDVSKSFEGPRRRTVLTGISLDLAPGDYVAVMGESGIGKSTLLNLVAGLDRPDSGEIVFDGERPRARSTTTRLTLLRRDRMGFVFQAFHVLPHLTLEQNVGAAAARCAAPRRPTSRAARAPGSRRSASPGARTAIRANSPAANCSASPSPAR